MNFLDILVVGLVIVSGLFAFARGFVRECLSIASWLGATVAAVYGMPAVRPFAEKYLPHGAIADAVAYGTIFIVTLVALTIATGFVARMVQRSSLSALDRTLGLIFGLGRGALMVAIFFLALSFALPGGEKPQWIAQSRTAPLFVGAVGSLNKLLPDSIRERVAKFGTPQHVQGMYENALRAYTLPSQAGRTGGPAGPSAEDQQRLNELIRRYGKGETPSGGGAVYIPPSPQPQAQ